MMIDWVSAKIPLSHFEKLRGGKFTAEDADGVIDYEFDRSLPVKGSYSSKITIKTLHTGPNGELYFSGNPAKFLQGHNLFGSTDIIGMMAATLERVFAILNITPSAENLARIHSGDYELTRIDVTAMYELPSLSDVRAWIRAAAHASRSRHKSAGILSGDTLYWGKNSRRWTMKAYAKGQEILASGHELNKSLPHYDELVKWAQNKLRVELVLRGPQLKKEGINTAIAFSKMGAASIFQKYRERIAMSENFTLTSALVETLPNYLRCTYVLWERGEDLRNKLSKNTYYRHRRELREQGVDISVKRSEESTNTIPLIQVLEALPVGIPDFHRL